MDSLSIITITYNAEAHLRYTLESIKSQSVKPREFIIIDGSSTDQTLSIIEEFSEIITKVVSEPDNGISDAMNKGLSLSTSEFVLFLHSDDFFMNSRVLEQVIPHLNSSKDILAFDAVILRTQGGEERRAAHWDFRVNFKTPLNHQATFCRRNLFDRIGKFDTSLRIAMDYDFFLRAYRIGAKVKLIPLPITYLRDTGISSRKEWKELKNRFSEERLVHSKNTNSLGLKALYFFYWKLYLPYRFFRSTFFDN